MAIRKKPVITPLHLLQQLSHSLLEHLEQACSQALVDAEKLLAKLEKQRGKAQDKLHKAGARLEEAAAAGKAKAQAKARASIAELEELLDTLKERQTETRDYILQLKADAEQSLHLAQGVGKVREAVAFLATADGTPGIFVKGREVVLNYGQRPPTFADSARKAALDASKATGGKSVKVYVVDSPDVATAIPAAGQFLCSISADDGRMAGNNC